MSQEQYRAVVVGCGRGGENIGVHSIGYVHGNAYTKHPRTRIDGACDIDVSNMDRFCDHFSVPHKNVDAEALIREVRPDILSICTYVAARPALIDMAVRYGVKSIWCEKPFSLTIQEGREMLDLCERHGIKLIINHYRRYLDLWNQAKALVKEGRIGQLQFVYGSFDGWDQMEMGTHLLDMIRNLLDDEPVSWVMGQVECTGAKVLYRHVVEEHSVSYFSFLNGVRALYDGSRHFPGEAMMRLNGTDGFLEVFPDGRLKLVAKSESEEIKSTSDWSNPLPGGADPYQLLLEDFVSWIEGGDAPRIHGRNGLASTELYLACYESARSRTRIDLPLKPQNGFPLDEIAGARAA
jgi:predicted dehydrogenase